jgi:hypothetical protein
MQSFISTSLSTVSNPFPLIGLTLAMTLVLVLIFMRKYRIAKKNGEALGLSPSEARWQAIVNTDVMAASSTASVAVNRQVDLISTNENITLSEKLRQLDEALAAKSITQGQYDRTRTRLLGQV